ncbi:MAG TPA: hypothetical protein VJV21_06070 [Pyrinomonadaceae bacterium]|nr:hypothetical protein [Pyrinomonadaceae bacterium]
MKRCPKCQRTYADDAFTFCLEDGALLSAPYDPEKKDEPLKTIQSGGPPPTAVLPAPERSGRELPPTVKTAPSPTNAEEAKAQLRVHPESPRRTSPLKYVVIGLVALVIVAAGFGFLGLYVAGTSNCPRLVISCGPSEPATYCSLVEDKSHTFNHNDSKPISGALCSRSVILLQAAAPAPGVANVSWSVSAGTIRSNSPLSLDDSQISIDTSGLSGKTLEVKANVTSSSWFCSQTVSTSFVVPAGLGPPAK